MEFYWPRFLRIVRCLPACLSGCLSAPAPLLQLFLAFLLLLLLVVVVVAVCFAFAISSALILALIANINVHTNEREEEWWEEETHWDCFYYLRRASKVDVYIGKYFKYLLCGGVVFVALLPYNWNFY